MTEQKTNIKIDSDEMLGSIETIEANAFMRALVLLYLNRDTGEIPPQKQCVKDLSKAWEMFHLDRYGYFFPCSGIPHLYDALNILLHMRFIKRKTDSKRTFYQLTPLGYVVAKRLQTKLVFVATAYGNKANIPIDTWIRIAYEIYIYSQAYPNLSQISQDKLEEIFPRLVAAFGW